MLASAMLSVHDGDLASVVASTGPEPKLVQQAAAYNVKVVFGDATSDDTAKTAAGVQLDAATGSVMLVNGSAGVADAPGVDDGVDLTLSSAADGEFAASVHVVADGTLQLWAPSREALSLDHIADLVEEYADALVESHASAAQIKVKWSDYEITVIDIGAACGIRSDAEGDAPSGTWALPGGTAFGEALRACDDVVTVRGLNKWIIMPQRKPAEGAEGCCAVL